MADAQSINYNIKLLLSEIYCQSQMWARHDT